MVMEQFCILIAMVLLWFEYDLCALKGYVLGTWSPWWHYWDGGTFKRLGPNRMFLGHCGHASIL